MTEHANGGSFACSVDIDAPLETAEINSVEDSSAEIKTEPAIASGFARFGFGPELLKALEAVGYQEPSPIQKAAIPELMLGRDLVGQAQTGTGKTAAFALPMLAALDPDQRKPQVLVLAPTRELALQVAEAFNGYASHLPGVRTLAIYGGADFRDQIHQLKRGVQIVVGTPGRVMDHMRQGTLDLSSLRALVLDEADEMLRMGFIDDVEWVLEQLPEQRQVVLFSATMPPEIRRISQKYLNAPAEITIKQKAADATRIRQRFLMVHAPHKQAALERVLEAETSEGVIIFARTKAITLTVAESLEQHGYDVAVLNGDVPQAQRERTIERLKSGQVDVLVATDVAARGLDVERISLVINYDIPFDSEAYVHRIGRTGRAGRSGDAILFLTPRERRFLGGMERAVGKPIEEMEVPSNATINQNRLDRMRTKLTNCLQTPASSEQERALLSEILQRVAQEQGSSPEQLALAALELSLVGKPLLLQGEENFQQVRQNGPGRDGGRDSGRDGGRDFGRDRGRGREMGREVGRDLGRGAAPRGERPVGPPEDHMERFRVELGWRDRIKPGNIVGAIANEAGLNGRSIGRIQIFDTHSTVDLPKGMPEDVFQGLRQLRVMNKPLQLSRFQG
ncbi:ATP-dependent RNA helicase DeaD [Cyanobium usitatum str. Tous]|uniref:DEAD/DEAH box helicase n=1 Tax=Cyanobium usitatum TaxID=2304190 RepID=UPI002AD21AC4|nr:DEAD/DEAH box helicase [Cyanobium usitatum]CAK6694845.1 ATP-dependent RNA helicase DeaD [Cyanobium usitatum str. Tous]